MHIRMGILGACPVASVILVSPAGATEVQSTSYSTWLAAASGAPAEWNMNVDSPGQVNGPSGNGYTLSGESAPGFSGSSQAEQTKLSSAASTERTISTTGAPSVDAAAAVTIGSGLLLFGARRKVFSNISALRA